MDGCRTQGRSLLQCHCCTLSGSSGGQRGDRCPHPAATAGNPLSHPTGRRVSLSDAQHHQGPGDQLELSVFSAFKCSG